MPPSSSHAFAYQAGAASVCVTLKDSYWLAGYAVRTAPPVGKVSELHASAVVLKDAVGQRLVIVSLEIISLNAKIAARIADELRIRYGLLRHELVLTATHTHYAPEYRVDKALFFHIPPEYAAKFCDVEDHFIDAAARAVDEAIGRLETVRLYSRSTTAGFAHNRRRHGVKAGTPSPEDVVDHDVPILECVDVSGIRKAIVFGYACHCTTIPPEDLRYCGDWAGFAKEQLERANRHATALFIPGAGADQDPEPRASLELSRGYGTELALAVQGSLDGAQTEITGPMSIGWEEVQLELEPVTRDKIERMLESDDPPQVIKGKFLLDTLARGETLITSYCAPIQIVTFGDKLLWIALSGEPVVDWARIFKDSYAGAYRQVWIAGYCNDVFDYVPTRRIQKERGYEGGRANLWNWIPAPFTDDVEARITEAVGRLVERVRESP